MSILDTITSKLKRMFSGEPTESDAQFLQWIHRNSTRKHCIICQLSDKRIFENNADKPLIGNENHLLCECYYKDIEQKSVG